MIKLFLTLTSGFPTLIKPPLREETDSSQSLRRVRVPSGEGTSGVNNPSPNPLWKLPAWINIQRKPGVDPTSSQQDDELVERLFRDKLKSPTLKKEILEKQRNSAFGRYGVVFDQGDWSAKYIFTAWFPQRATKSQLPFKICEVGTRPPLSARPRVGKKDYFLCSPVRKAGVCQYSPI
ncbi:hypothetical protein JCGZ_15174 [Jatropha curcas]|uniref:Uncharacterized protein n=1 Tax=Jatropha curcas TaxID=180498 RepID=A0A067KET6_JATCU|nr:hypothetical protein JCGZ_15174 [Jatropha curcas]